MVAYNFKQGFVPRIQAKTKRQTVRGHRKRHARPDEPVQLYTGMRTRHCRPILTPDPICLRLDEIAIDVGRDGMLIRINGIPLSPEEAEAFAVLDGFGWPEPHGVSALAAMRRFWAMTHGLGRFEGVVVHWDPSGCSMPPLTERKN